MGDKTRFDLLIDIANEVAASGDPKRYARCVLEHESGPDMFLDALAAVAEMKKTLDAVSDKLDLAAAPTR